MTPNEILAVLRAERQRAGLSLGRLAVEHGVSVATVRSHEAGERAMSTAQLVEHASWFGLEVVLLPKSDGGLFQRGYDHCRAQVAQLLGLGAAADGPRPGAVDWDAALGDAHDEIERESTDA